MVGKRGHAAKRAFSVRLTSEELHSFLPQLHTSQFTTSHRRRHQMDELARRDQTAFKALRNIFIFEIFPS
jgi:hypothetical protein